MRAELDYVHGKPVLRLERSTYNKRAVVDLPLTDDQRRMVEVNIGVLNV